MMVLVRVGGGHIIFAFAVRRPVLHLVSAPLRKKYNSYHYQIWHAGLLGSLPGIAFGEGSSIAIRVIAT